jgi:hypothetical protein
MTPSTPLAADILDAHAATLPVEHFTVLVAAGKQGRASMVKAPHSMLAEHEILVDDPEAPNSPDGTELARRVLAEALALQEAGSHRFDAEYMAGHGGAYGINLVTVDAGGAVTGYVAPAYRPTSAGGHVFLKRGDDVYDLVRRLYPSISRDAAEETEIHCVLAKVRDLDVVVAMPDGFLTARVAHKLRLEFVGDGTENVMVLRGRLCDRGGLARSVMHFSTPKWRFLFPGAPVDLTQKRAKRPRGQRGGAGGAGEAAEPKRARSESEVFEKLCEAVVKSWGASAQSGQAVEILHRCVTTLGVELFDRVFQRFESDTDAFPEILTDEVRMREVISDTLDPVAMDAIFA